MTIQEMQERAYAIAHEKGWHDEERSFGDDMALAHSELSEALEAYRESGFATWLRGGDSKPEGVAYELADVVIRVMHTCQKLGIDLEQAIAAKMDFNASRPHRHGGKRL